MRTGRMGGQTGRGSGAQVEQGRMQRAFDEAALDIALGERGVLVAAGVIDGVETALGVEDRDGRCGVVDLDPDGLTLGQVLDAADGNHLAPSR